MIQSVGLDTVTVNRFNQWHNYTDHQLQKLFSDNEIAYCKSSIIKSAERFAVRFAAREALVKALSGAFPEKQFSLLTVCKNSAVVKTPNGAVALSVNWDNLIGPTVIPPHVALSFAHEKTHAIAIVILTLNEPEKLF